MQKNQNQMVFDEIWFPDRTNNTFYKVPGAQTAANSIFYKEFGARHEDLRDRSSSAQPPTKWASPEALQADWYRNGVPKSTWHMKKPSGADGLAPAGGERL